MIRFRHRGDRIVGYKRFQYSRVTYHAADGTLLEIFDNLWFPTLGLSISVTREVDA